MIKNNQSIMGKSEKVQDSLEIQIILLEWMAVFTERRETIL